MPSSRAALSLSRSTFRSSFADQYSRLVLGTVACLQPLW